MRKLEINVSKKYDVLLGSGLTAEAGNIIADTLGLEDQAARQSIKICVITDEVVDSIYGSPKAAIWRSLEDAGFKADKFVIKGGEQHKNISTIDDIVEFLASKRYSRNDVLIALGGGITGDITGFAAAVYKRGIRFIQIPTTLLSDVDSSIGGKTGVNLRAGKNLAGAFWQPEVVIIDPDYLKTLPYERLLDGLAEILKAGMIADKTILEAVQAEDFSLENTEDLADIMYKALKVKRDIVVEDEMETGNRKLLNLGHTIGHAIEKCSDYSITHGCAVASGTYMISVAAEKLGWVTENSSVVLRNIMERFGYDLLPDYPVDDLAAAASNDKKVQGSDITLVYADYPGHCVLKTVASADMKEIIALSL